MGVDGFSDVIINKDKLYLVRFFDKKNSAPMTLENSYDKLYEMKVVENADEILKRNSIW